MMVRYKRTSWKGFRLLKNQAVKMSQKNQAKVAQISGCALPFSRTCCPRTASYAGTWNTPLTIAFGELGLTKAAILWINDGLMAVFFFVVGLEIKREMLLGELASLKSAAFPVVATVGGVVVPALVYVFFNYNTEGISGWGVPMATDIAFALGIMTLLEKRVPLSLKLFLVAFAIVDDICAVLVIALFYTAEANFMFLIGALLVFGLLMVMSVLRVHSTWLYILLGIVMWVLFLTSGVYATIAGILLAVTIPARSKITEPEVVSSTNDLLAKLQAIYSLKQEAQDLEEEQYQAAVYTIDGNCKVALSPLHRLEHALHPWVAYAFMPVFALANAGIYIGASLTSGFSNPIS